ncbi:hypothetical protein [Salinibacter altiplanensis]|uniref:hypothetical protein n=1 Tax=Salinibacter altiplanensis TaxID=1803181 RepID=UPI000C9F0A24|nr:hypothetical protein [Salinibacter altiplanensis]
MGLFSAGRGPRSFDYRPRHHDPEEDDRDIRRRMKSRRAQEAQRSPLSLLFFLALLFLTVLLYYSL